MNEPSSGPGKRVRRFVDPVERDGTYDPNGLSFCLGRKTQKGSASSQQLKSKTQTRSWMSPICWSTGASEKALRLEIGGIHRCSNQEAQLTKLERKRRASGLEGLPTESSGNLIANNSR
jgi:hypothetical protein